MNRENWMIKLYGKDWRTKKTAGEKPAPKPPPVKKKED
jgi:hypothetical protein